MITCLKYSNDMVNFFPSPGSYFEDIIRIPYIEDMPIDNRENTGRDNYFQAKKGEFDIIIDFTVSSGVTSALTGKTVREFFEEKSKRILVVYEYGSYKRSGFIARETMKFDYTYNKGNDKLRFTCTGIIGELVNYLSLRSLPNYNNTNSQFITFNTFFIQDLLEDVNQTRLTIVNNLNIVAKCEGQIYLSTPLYNDMKSRVLHIEELNKWIFFKQLCYTFGIKYDMECDFISPADNGLVTFRLTLDWRTTSGVERSFTLLEHQKSFQLPEQKKWVMIRDREWIYTHNYGQFRVEATVAAGILWSKDTMYYYNNDQSDIDNVFVLNRKVIDLTTNTLNSYLDGDVWKFDSSSGFPQLVPLVSDRNKIVFISDVDGERFSLSGYAPKFTAGVAILARLFVKSFSWVSNFPNGYIYTDNTEGILSKTAKAEYDFLLQDGEIDTKTTVFDFPKGSEVNLNDYTVINGNEYTFERVRLDVKTEQIETDLIKR